MQIFQSIAPNGPLLKLFVFMVVIYGLRYFAMAIFAFFIAHRGWGRAHADTPLAFDTLFNVRRELLYSFLTVLMFGMFNAALYGWQWLVGATQLYFHISAYPVWWFWLSIPTMIVLHDTFFYWIHRAMHTRMFYSLMHKVHHQSVYPTSFAAYSMHPTETIGEALIVVAILFIIPVHPLAFLIFMTISTAYIVYGHCGREFFSKATPSHWLGRWLNTSTAHAVHHLKGRYNYGLYFMGWDRLMKTVDPEFEAGCLVCNAEINEDFLSSNPSTITMDRLAHWLTINRKRYFFFPRTSNRALRQLGGILAIGFSLLMMVSSFTHAAPLPIPSAVEIMEKSIEAIRFKDSFANATLTLTSREGVARVRKTSGYTKLRANGTDNMRLVRFLAPADIKGTATLMIENSKGDDDMWVYLPALSKVRRLSASNKGDAFVGTDFSYGDIIGHKTSDWIHKLIKEDVVDGAPCYLIDSLPANDTVKANSGYSKRETCVHKDNFVAIRTDMWDAAGQPLKRIQVSNLKQVGSAGHWQPLLWIAENLQTGHKTTIQFDVFKAEINAAEKLFTPQELDK